MKLMCSKQLTFGVNIYDLFRDQMNLEIVKYLDLVNQFLK